MGGTVTEGNGGSPVVPFTVSIEKAIDEDLTFSYISSGGTATAGLDYTPVNGVGTIAKGQTSMVINVPVKPDSVIEQDETLSLEIRDNNVPVIRVPVVPGTINDDDSAPPPGPAPADTRVTETSGSGIRQAWFAVDLPAARSVAVNCTVSTRDGSATAGEDYRPMTNGILTFAAGETRKWVALTVTASPVLEDTEQFYLDVKDSMTQQVATAACTIERFAVTALTPAPGGAFQVRFPTGLGQRYFVEEAATPSGAWSLSSAVITGTGLPLDQSVYPAGTRRFFRVREHSPLPPGTAALNN
jgi:hypothetical protein